MVHGFLLINFDTIFYVRYRSEEISPLELLLTAHSAFERERSAHKALDLLLTAHSAFERERSAHKALDLLLTAHSASEREISSQGS